MTNPGVDYEKLIHAVYSAAMRLTGLSNVKVIHDVDLPGKTRDESGTQIKHQVDVYWEFDIAGITYRAVVQAKDWQSNVTKEKVLAFKAVLDDLPGQPRGIMITRTGYQSGAELYAREHGIELYLLNDTNARGELDEVTVTGVGAHWDTAFTDVHVMFESKWHETHSNEHIEDLMRQVDAGEPYIFSMDGTPIEPVCSVFEKIRNAAILTGEESPVLHAFAEPVQLKTFEMSEGLVLDGISARFELSNEIRQDITVNVAKMFSLVLRHATGRNYYVDSEYRLHERTKDQHTLCDFCGVPVPDDDSNTFSTKRVLTVTKRFEDDMGFPHVFAAGAWGGCEECGNLIRAGNRLGLFERAKENMKGLYDSNSLPGLVVAHNVFWKAYLELPPVNYLNDGRG